LIGKEEILAEIKRTTESNGGKPLGMAKFEKEIGIKRYDWQKHWAKFSDAITEAGFTPNSLQGAYSDKFLIEKFIELMRKLNKFPTASEIRLEACSNDKFPYKSTYENRYGSKQHLASKIIEYCSDKNSYEDILEFCEPVIKTSSREQDINGTDTSLEVGEVYLYKHGNRNEYKIGKSKDSVQRGKELRVQMPEDLKLVHVIKTDDPSGIEAYWHKRFVDKRKNGEWFGLNSTEVKAFKRWRRIH
jgi:hypothetical protein